MELKINKEVQSPKDFLSLDYNRLEGYLDTAVYDIDYLPTGIYIQKDDFGEKIIIEFEVYEEISLDTMIEEDLEYSILVSDFMKLTDPIDYLVKKIEIERSKELIKRYKEIIKDCQDEIELLNTEITE